MDFVKQHIFFIVCGVAGVIGIVLGVTGMSRMSDVQEEMSKSESLYSGLGGLGSTPANQQWIQAEQKRIEEQLKNYHSLIDKAKELNPYKPLLEGVFPDGDRDKRLAFRKAYGRAFHNILGKLHYGRPATAPEIEQMTEEIRIEQKRQQGLGLDQESSQEPDEPYTLAGVMTKFGAKKDPNARANITKAQRFYCYAEPFNTQAVPTLEYDGYMIAGEGDLEAPKLYDCWFAQLSLWIQQDIITKLASFNEQAAVKLIAQDKNPWVGTLPIKDVISLRIGSGYITEPSEESANSAGAPRFSPAGGSNAADVTDTADASFNYRLSNDAVDVVQFTSNWSWTSVIYRL